MSYLIDVTNVTNREVENFPKMLELPANTVVGQVASFDSFVFAYNGSKWIMLSNQEETPRDVVFFAPKDDNIDDFKITPRSVDPNIPARYGVYFIADSTVMHDVDGFIDKTKGNTSKGIFLWEVDASNKYKPMDKIVGYKAENIQVFDVSKEENLKYLNIAGSDLDLTGVDVDNQDYYSINKNPNLVYIDYSDSSIPYDFKDPIETVIADRGDILPLFTEGSTTMESLSIKNMTQPLDEQYFWHIVDGCPNLKEINFNNNSGLVDLNFNLSPKIKYVQCKNNELTSLDITSNRYFHWLLCNNNDLYSLKLPKPVSEISHLECSNNIHLSGIDVGSLDKLTFLRIDSTSITSIDLSTSTNIGDIYAQGSRLSTLDVSGRPYLGKVYVHDMHDLVSINLSNNPRFKILDASRSPSLTSAIITGNDILYNVFLSETALSSIDFTGTTAITTLRTYKMPNLTNLDLSPFAKSATISTEDTPLTSVIPPSVPFKSITLYGTQLNGAQMDTFFTALPDASGVSPTPVITLAKSGHTSVPIDGLSACDPTIATNKGYSVVTS